jgi:hypothetical protein
MPLRIRGRVLPNGNAHAFNGHRNGFDAIRAHSGLPYLRVLRSPVNRELRRQLFYARTINEARVLLLRHFIAELEADGNGSEEFVAELTRRADELEAKPELSPPWSRVDDRSLHQLQGDLLRSMRDIQHGRYSAEAAFETVEARPTLPNYVQLPWQLLRLDVKEAAARLVQGLRARRADRF